MANSNDNTQFISNEVLTGLAQLENHLRAEDGEIESLSSELWDSWPVRQALTEFSNDPESVLAVLAGRMFLAGSESAQSTALLFGLPILRLVREASLLLRVGDSRAIERPLGANAVGRKRKATLHYLQRERRTS